jgi:hypothetical protein
VQIGVLNRDLFPYTTDLVFGLKGFNITFAVESPGFIPVPIPFEDHIPKDEAGNGSAGKPDSENTRDRDKKQKNESRSEVNKAASSSGPTPIQIALTPFPKGVDVKKIIAIPEEEKYN